MLLNFACIFAVGEANTESLSVKETLLDFTLLYSFLTYLGSFLFETTSPSFISVSNYINKSPTLQTSDSL